MGDSLEESLKNLSVEELEKEKAAAYTRNDGARVVEIVKVLRVKQPWFYDPDNKEGAERESSTAKSEERRETKSTELERKKFQLEYAPFLDDWKNGHINERNLEADCGKKKASLLRYRRFQEGGEQPISDYSCWAVGALYKKVLKTAKESERQAGQ